MSTVSGNPQLRRGTEADLTALLALTRACIADMRACGIEQWDDVYPDAAVFSRDIAARALWLYFDDHQLVGTFAIDRRFDPLWSGLAWTQPEETAGAVHRLMVHPAHSGHGLGAQLMSHAERLAHAAGASSMRLDCFTANPAAVRLYEKLGYHRVGEALMRKGLFVAFEKHLA